MREGRISELEGEREQLEVEKSLFEKVNLLEAVKAAYLEVVEQHFQIC